MPRRIVLDEPEEHAQARAPLFPEHVKRGKGVWKYSRASLALLVRMQPAGIRSAERRGELVLSDLASVSRFVLRRLRWQERRQLRDKRRALSVNTEKMR